MSKVTNTPRHVGLILDGNRRWAKEQGLPTLEGHRRGAEVLKTISKDFFDKGVEVVSAFVFSTENWNRSEKEVNYLMKLIKKFINDYLQEAVENNIQIILVGSRDQLSGDINKMIRDAESRTADNTGGTMALCLNYGGRKEIVDAVKRILKSGLDPESLNEECFDQYLYSGRYIGDVDMVVRTSGEQRLSGFMMWRAPYAELMFIDKHWPDFNEKDVDAVLAEYASRQRRFGR